MKLESDESVEVPKGWDTRDSLEPFGEDRPVWEPFYHFASSSAAEVVRAAKELCGRPPGFGSPFPKAKAYTNDGLRRRMGKSPRDCLSDPGAIVFFTFVEPDRGSGIIYTTWSESPGRPSPTGRAVRKDGDDWYCIPILVLEDE